jgi:hypothetical protein
MSQTNPALTLFATGTTNPHAPAARDIPIDPWHAILLCAFVLLAVVVGFMIRHNIVEDRRKRAQVASADSKPQDTSKQLHAEAAALGVKMRARRAMAFDAPTMPMDYNADRGAVGVAHSLEDADVWGDVPAPRVSTAGQVQRPRVVPSPRT